MVTKSPASLVQMEAEKKSLPEPTDRIRGEDSLSDLRYGLTLCRWEPKVCHRGLGPRVTLCHGKKMEGSQRYRCNGKNRRKCMSEAQPSRSLSTSHLQEFCSDSPSTWSVLLVSFMPSLSLCQSWPAFRPDGAPSPSGSSP